MCLNVCLHKCHSAYMQDKQLMDEQQIHKPTICSSKLTTKTNIPCGFPGKYLHSDNNWYCGHHLPKKECTICFENCTMNNTTVLNCAHVFHTQCLKRWVRRGSMTCPLCRTELPTSLDIPWFRMTTCFRSAEFSVLPPYHPELMSEVVIDFFIASGMTFTNILQLQFEKPNVYWEFANLVRYWLQFGNADTDTISKSVARKFKSFAKKHSVEHVLRNNFARIL